MELSAELLYTTKILAKRIWDYADLGRAGLETLTAFATHAHPLQTRRGRGYHSAPLPPCLGPLERLEAVGALRPALVPQQVGQLADVDGPMSASWRRVPMHQGTRTMLGRILAGSQAVITPEEAGQGLCVASLPPDPHRSQCLVASGQQVPLAPGLSVVVIDRAVHALALARAFAHQDLGLLGMRDAKEHPGLESCAATWEERRQEGTKVSSGPGTLPRADEPRHCVLVEPVEGQTLVDGGTPRVKATVEPTAWPPGSRARSESQDNSFQRLLDHGALTTH